MNWNALAALAAVGATIATAAGFGGTVWMILSAARQARTKWEDDLTHEYRRIMQRLPLGARLNEHVPDCEFEGKLPAFLDYFDLSNQQAILRKSGRVSRDTWAEWRAGIGGSLQSVAFAKAWTFVQQRNPGLFAELKELEATKFVTDPPDWKRSSRW